MIWRGLPPIPNKIASHVRQDYTISISWAEGSESSVQPSSNGSWFWPMMCLILTPSFFLGSTGQCAAGINRLQSDEPRNAPSVTKTCNQHHWSDARHRCLEPSYQFSSERIIWKQTVKRYKEAEFQILTSESGWDDSLFVEKTSTKRVPTVALATLREVFHDLEV